MPLAIELAAARTKVLSVEQISNRLVDSFALLTGGGRTALAHQGTLRATMDWSHDLLSEEQKVLFGRLSVFAGGFTLEAAEAVCAGEGLQRKEVPELLFHLVEKSLVVMRERDGEARYRLLETLRQYAREKLEESAEETEVSRRHAEFFLKLAERAEPELKGHWQVAWLARLETDHDNLRAAMRHFVDHGGMESAARLAWALWFFWRAHGYQGEGYRYTGEALEQEGTLSTDARATLLCARGIMSYGLESTESTEQLWKRSADMFRQTNNRSGLALALGGLALMALARGDMERSTTRFGESMTIYREIGDRWGMGSVLVHEGLIPLSKGQYTQAVRYFEEGLEIAQEIGDRLIWAHALHHLAWASQLQEKQQRAAQFYVEGLGVAVELGDGAGVAYCLEGIASLGTTETEPERKARLFGASEAILETVGTPLYVQIQDREVYNHAVEELRSSLGEEAFEAAWAQGRAMTPEQAVEYALEPPKVPSEPAASAYPSELSAREVDVLKLVARGMTNAQIAKELFISPRTVNAHLRSIYHKLGFSTRAEATRFASEHDLL
jgi:non-specific serine/threonine protein kinase